MTMVPVNLSITMPVSQKSEQNGHVDVKNLTQPGIVADLVLTTEHAQDLKLADIVKLRVEFKMQDKLDVPPTEISEWIRKALIKLLEA